MIKNDSNTISISFLDMLSNFMTEEEIANINAIDITPEYIIECFRETPGITQATYLGDNIYELESEIAGKFEVRLVIKDGVGKTSI